LVGVILTIQHFTLKKSQYQSLNICFPFANIASNYALTSLLILI